MTRILPRPLIATAIVACLAACAGTSPRPPVDARTQQVLSAMSARLTSARTLRFSATRTAPSGFHAAVDFGESTQMTGVMRRPDKIVVTFHSTEGERQLGYDGTQLVLVDYKAGTHARSLAPPTGEAVLRALDITYNYVPSVAELLTSDPQNYLLENVLSVRHAGQNVIEGVLCDHLFFQQKKRSRDLWVSTTDHLPRRITTTYPNGGATPLALVTTIRSWQLNTPVTDAELAVKIPAGSRKTDPVPLRH